MALVMGGIGTLRLGVRLYSCQAAASPACALAYLTEDTVGTEI
jgi:hypothetical protein